MNAHIAATLLPAVFLLGALQVLGTSPEDDPAYKVFAMDILSQKQQVEDKLNKSRETFINNTITFNLPEFDLINTTLSECFAKVEADYKNVSDQFCLDFIGQNVQEFISDSKNELDACTNLTYSWALIDELLSGAKEANNNLDKVTSELLNKALTCVTSYPRNPSLKNSCFWRTYQSFQPAFLNASSLAQKAFYQISGGGLLMGAEVTSCQEAEQFSFEKKCATIKSEVITDCVTSTTSTTTTEPPP